MLGPNGGHVLAIRRMQPLNEPVDFRGHDAQDACTFDADGGEGVRRPSRHNVEHSGIQTMPSPSVLHVDAPLEDDEALVAVVVHV